MHEAAVFDRWEGGFGWMAFPDEPEQRTSHAIAADGEVWVVDPVDFDGLDDRLDELGPVAGVVLLLDRHKRDSVAVANRHDVPIYLPGPLGAIADELDAPTEPVSGDLAGTGYEILPVVDRGFWREAALYDGGTLLVPEALGTSEFFTVGAEPLGVHVALRLLPPKRQLGGLTPRRVLVGHGEGVMTDGTAALRSALKRSRRTAPRLFAKDLKLILTAG